MVLTAVVVLAIVAGFYQAWNIGANDVANAMGTSVGSKAVTFRQAIIIAGVCEFLGAVLVGGHVTQTIRKGMLDVGLFAGDPDALIRGMLASLLAAGTFLLVATSLGLPVSTTHAAVGGVMGVGVARGLEAVNFRIIFQIMVYWVLTVPAAAITSMIIFKIVRLFYH